MSSTLSSWCLSAGTIHSLPNERNERTHVLPLTTRQKVPARVIHQPAVPAAVHARIHKLQTARFLDNSIDRPQEMQHRRRDRRLIQRRILRPRVRHEAAIADRPP